ncbi:hypothetical protein ECZU22_51660 [Escherichia coli]|nr:hypothetical protein ECZU22_51660 [Escherichia coli]
MEPGDTQSRYVIDRVTAQSHSLTLRDAQGETQVVRISSRQQLVAVPAGKMPVADGERLRVTGKFPDSASPAVTACRWHPSVKMR